MEYKKGLGELRNSYPADTTNGNIEDSYRYDNGNIKYSGIYPKNFITFQTLSLSDIQLGSLKLDSTIKFKFIIKFINEDGTMDEWTSESFLNSLLKAQQESDPFFSRDRVTVAIIDFGLLSNYWKSEKFDIGEKYAEVRITNTIKTKEDIIKHINYIISAASDDDVRDWTLFGSFEYETSELDQNGNLIGNLGFSTVNNKTIDSNDIEETLIPTQPQVITSAPPVSDSTISTQTIAVAPPPPASTYPFSTGGNYTGDTRINIKTGVAYEWTNGTWVISNYVI